MNIITALAIIAMSISALAMTRIFRMHWEDHKLRKREWNEYIKELKNTNKQNKMKTKQELAAELRQKVTELNLLANQAELAGLNVKIETTTSRSQKSDLIEVEVSEKIIY